MKLNNLYEMTLKNTPLSCLTARKNCFKPQKCKFKSVIITDHVMKMQIGSESQRQIALTTK